MRRLILLVLVLMSSTAGATTTKIIPGGGDLDSLIETCAEGKLIKIVSGEPACADDDTGAGGADATAIHDNVAGEISPLTDKLTPVAADHMLIEDSEAANAKKHITVGALETALEGVLDLDQLQGTLGTGQLASGATLDTEWDTEAEVETVWGGVNVLLETEIDASSELAALMDDETGTGALCFATSPTFTTSVKFGSAGVQVSDDGDGAITLLGLGNGADEDLTLNLDDVLNTGTFTSSTGLATLNFSGISLQESGNAVPNAADGLGFFASTTSAQLDTVISDDTGTGSLVFNDTPALITPVILSFAGSTHNHENAAGGGTLDGDAFDGSGIDGRSITLAPGTPDVLDADPELYTDDDCYTMRIAAGIADTDDIDTIFRTTLARTVTNIWCETDAATVTINLNRDDGTPAAIATANLACDTTAEDACASGCSTTLVGAEAALAAGDKVDLAISAVTATATRLTVCLTTTRDD